MDPMNDELATRRKEFVEMLGQAEHAYQQAQGKVQKYRSLIAAIDLLIGLDQPGDPVGDPELDVEDLDELGPFTPVREYWKPILQVLVDLGGRGNRMKVIEMVGERMKHILTPADYGKLPKTGFVRWRNRVAWQASQMRSTEAGYIKRGSHRGFWEITEEGRRWLDDKRN